MSAQDDGSSSIQLYLKRDTSVIPNYFYYPMVIHGKTFNLQPSAFDNNIGVIGSTCPDDKCKGMDKLNIPTIGQEKEDEMHFKDFGDEDANITGFYY